jgi:hypothetical protein
VPGIENAVPVEVLEFSEVAAWGLIVAVLVYVGLKERAHLREAGAVALATAAALVTKAMLLPLL